jgi:hypothetical protein
MSDLQSQLRQFIVTTRLTSEVAISQKLDKDNQLKNQYHRGRLAICRELDLLLNTEGN